MNVSDMMTARPVTINQRQNVHQALEIMEKIGCHHLPVMSSDGHLVGIVTDRDCRRALRVCEQCLQDCSENGDDQPVGSIMSPAPIIVEPSASVEEAARLMVTNHVSSLPVMRGETLVGIITTTDILMAFIRLYQQAVAAGTEETGIHAL